MGSIYPRGGVLWLAFLMGGRRVLKSTGLKVGEEEKAKQMLEEIEARLLKDDRVASIGPVYFDSYVDQWEQRRLARGLRNAKRDAQRLRIYAVPTLGKMLLRDIKPRHIRDLVHSWTHPVAGAPAMAPRTILSAYGWLRQLFRDATAAELIDASPCVLMAGDLPSKADKDPAWRSRARFTRGEVETLISDTRLSLHRRVLYGLAFLTGMRGGEIAALRWSSYDTEREGLGCLYVTSSYTRANREETGTKTDHPREVPVHPTLAALLAEWKLDGYAKVFAQQPSPESLLLPNLAGDYITDLNLGDWRRRDLEKLGMRERRGHDMRRTMISIGRGDGANPDVLRTITHDGKGDQFDEYTTFTWAEKCAAISCLRVQRLAGQVIALPAVSGGYAAPTETVATVAATVEGKPLQTTELLTETAVPRERFEVPPKRQTSTQLGAIIGRRSAEGLRKAPADAATVATVATIVRRLRGSANTYARSGDADRLAAELEDLLATLRGRQ